MNGVFCLSSRGGQDSMSARWFVSPLMCLSALPKSSSSRHQRMTFWVCTLSVLFLWSAWTVMLGEPQRIVQNCFKVSTMDKSSFSPTVWLCCAALSLRECVEAKFTAVHDSGTCKNLTAKSFQSERPLFFWVPQINDKRRKGERKEAFSRIFASASSSDGTRTFVHKS